MERICVHCNEEIKPEEFIPEIEGKLHRECFLRSIAGSVAHQRMRCSCYGGRGHDNKKLTARENARAATRFFSEIQQKALDAKFN